MSLTWLRVAVFFYGIAALAVMPTALFDRPNWRRLAIPAAIAALFFHFVAFAEMLNAAHHTLPVDSHETQSLLALLLVAIFLGVYFRYRTVALGIFVLPVTILLTWTPAFHPGQETILLAHSGWIFIHVVLLLAAYAALSLSLVASLLYIVQERRLKAKQPALRSLPPLETTDQIALRTLLFGFPCMTTGLLIGTALAVKQFGASYFLDPKILLAFAMWLAYVAMIYIRRSSGLRGRRAVYLSSFVFLVILAVWAANQFSSVHRFSAP
ncbi:MAG: cytochrome c biogenesis protein CcsA [Acidobacteriota bacterium]|nr:cytochrome c biogenesis protein CcsA [Acidobacteriota bacterium]